MNITFWSGGAMLTGYALTYFSYQEKYNQYLHYYRAGESWQQSLNSANAWHATAKVFGWATLGCIGASAYFLVRYLLYENKDLGMKSGLFPDAITSLPNQQVMMHWRF